MAILGNFIRIDVSTDNGVTFRYLGRETGNQLEEQADTLRYVGREFKYPVFKKTTRTAQASVRGLIDYSSEVNYAQIQNWYASDLVLVFRIYAVGKPETIFNGQIVSFAKISDVGSSASYSFAIAIDGKPTVISLQQPTGLAATTGTLPGQINLSWTNNASGATGYEIWAKKAIETAFVQIATTTNLTSYTAELLDSGTSYNFQVRATAEAGASLFSNTATASTLTPAHVATAGFSGNVSPIVTKSGDTAIWRIGNVIITSNAPTFVVIPGTLVELHGTASQFTEINLNPLLVRSDLEIVGLTSLIDYSATAGNLDSVIFDSLVRRANVSIDLTNSVVPGATNVKIYNLIRSLLEANGGTYSDDGTNFTGTAGQNHSGRTLALGTVVLDPTTDQITLDMITALQSVGWTITTILTLCNKFLDLYLVKNTIVAGGQTVRYEIPKNYTTNRPANSPILISVDDSEIVPGTLSLKLFNTDGTTELASNFAAINTDLEANDRTGGFIEVSGLPTGDVAKVVVTISDFPTVEKVCGAFSSRGIYAPTYLSLLQNTGITAVSGNVETWEDVINTSNFQFTQANAALRPVNSSGSLSFPDGDRFLEFTGAKSNFNFLHSFSDSYAIVICLDVSSGIILHTTSREPGGSYTNIFFISKSASGGYYLLVRGAGGSINYNNLTPEIYANQKNILTVWVNSTQAIIRVDGLQSILVNRTGIIGTGDSYGDLIIGSGKGNGLRGIINDISIKKNPTLAEINVIEQILAAKNNLQI